MTERKCLDCSVSIEGRHWSSVRCEKCQTIARKKQHSQFFKKYYYDGPGKKDAKKWREDNKERVIHYRKLRQRWREEHKDLQRQQNNKYYSDNKDEVNKRQRSYGKRLTDYYIKKLLSCKKNPIPLKFDDIPDTLIELKRKQMIVYRYLQENDANGVGRRSARKFNRSTKSYRL